MSINWDDLVKDAGDVVQTFDVIPKGDYDMEVVEAKPGTTKDQSKKKYTIRAKIIGGASANRQIFDDIILTTDNPNALGFFFRKMNALGLSPDYFKQSRPSDDQICAALKGRRFRAKVGHRTWNGEQKHQIENYMPAPAGGGAPAGPPTQGAPGPAPLAPPAAAAPPPPAPAPAPQPAAPPAPQAQDPWGAGAPQAPQPGNPWENQAPAAQPAPAAAPEPQPATAGAPAVPPPPPSPF